jgi:Mg/Co/Ni transporter MgtE
MVTRVVAIPSTATVPEACEFFVLYKFFAFPVVDTNHHIIGVVDISLFTAEALEEKDPGSLGVAAQADEIFAALGVRLSQLRGASAWRVFRYRFPWLLATIFGGTMCTLLAGAFEATLASSVVIAFFLTMGPGPERERQHANHEYDHSGIAVAGCERQLVRDGVGARASLRATARHGLRRPVAAIVFVW